MTSVGVDQDHTVESWVDYTARVLPLLQSLITFNIILMQQIAFESRLTNNTTHALTDKLNPMQAAKTTRPT